MRRAAMSAAMSSRAPTAAAAGRTPLQEARAIYRERRGLQGLCFAGVHIHIGSQITTAEPLRRAAAVLTSLAIELAADGVLRASVGFGARMRDMVLNRTDMTRRIRKAFINHLAFVENPAYVGAEIIDVRDSGHLVVPDTRPPVVAREQVEELAAFLAAVKARHPGL